MPSIGMKVFASCGVAPPECQEVAQAIATRADDESPMATADQYLRSLDWIRIVRSRTDVDWALASFSLGGSPTWIGTAVVLQPSGFTQSWRSVGGFYTKTGDPPTAGSGNAWYDPVGSESSDVPTGLIGFVDPEATLVQTFDGEGGLADEAVPDQGFFAVKMPLPGQVAFHQADHLMFTQALVRDEGPKETSNREQPPDRAYRAANAVVHLFLGEGYRAFAVDVWLTDDARGSAAALSGVLGRGVWKRAGPADGRGRHGDPSGFDFAYPVTGPGGKGDLMISFKLVQGSWEIEAISYSGFPPSGPGTSS